MVFFVVGMWSLRWPVGEMIWLPPDSGDLMFKFPHLIAFLFSDSLWPFKLYATLGKQTLLLEPVVLNPSSSVLSTSLMSWLYNFSFWRISHTWWNWDSNYTNYISCFAFSSCLDFLADVVLFVLFVSFLLWLFSSSHYTQIMYLLPRTLSPSLSLFPSAPKQPPISLCLSFVTSAAVLVGHSYVSDVLLLF